MGERMGNFQEYFEKQFQSDLDRFLSSIPDESKRHSIYLDGGEITIQHDRLTEQAGHTAFLRGEHKERFGVVLFFLVLMDMVMYGHRSENYFSFRRVTQYPKWIGSCPGGCRFHLHPAQIFEAMSEGGGRAQFKETFQEAVPVMRDHFLSLFERNRLSAAWDSVWAECVREFPFRFRSGGAQLWETQIKMAKLDLKKRYLFKLGNGSVFEGKPQEFLDKIDEGHWTYEAVANCRLPTAIPEGQEPDPAQVREQVEYLRKHTTPGTRRVDLIFDDGTGFIGSIELAGRYLARRFAAMAGGYEIHTPEDQENDESYELPLPTRVGQTPEWNGKDPRF
jgi:hypothetical protein